MVQEISTEICSNTRKYNKQTDEYLCAAGEKPNPEKKQKSGEQNKYYSSEGKGRQAAEVSKYA
jgi:hypothetical protein